MYHKIYVFDDCITILIIQKLDILAEFNALHDGQKLFNILRGNKLYFRKKCTIVSVLANNVDADQMPHLGLHCLPKYCS